MRDAPGRSNTGTSFAASSFEPLEGRDAAGALGEARQHVGADRGGFAREEIEIGFFDFQSGVSGDALGQRHAVPWRAFRATARIRETMAREPSHLSSTPPVSAALIAVRHATVTGILNSLMRFSHSAGPLWWTESPFASTATVTGMSFTSNS